MLVIPGRRPVIFAIIFTLILGTSARLLLAKLLQQLGEPLGNRFAGRVGVDASEIVVYLLVQL